MDNTLFDRNALTTIVIFVVVAVTVIIIVRCIIISLANTRLSLYKHEEEMHNLNRVKEERKQLLDFCYDMAKKKESESEKTSPLDQIHHECWLIIKQMNEIRL